jgi:hypothetical protein
MFKRNTVSRLYSRLNKPAPNSALGYITPKDMHSRTPVGDSGRLGSEIGSGERTPEESPPGGRHPDQ